MKDVLERTEFTKSRSSEYLQLAELQYMTGIRNREQFPVMAFKELVDNALDEAELQSGPAVSASLRRRGSLLRICVEDNGRGLPPDTVEKVVDLTTRISDKEVYQAPTRGAQGNAFKTVVGLTSALRRERDEERATSLLVESRGERRRIRLGVDPMTGEPTPRIYVTESSCTTGTRIVVYLDIAALTLTRQPVETYVDVLADEIGYIARRFATFNPHVALHFNILGDDVVSPGDAEIGKPTKGTPTNAHHYTASDLRALVQSELKHARDMSQAPKTLRQFVGEFQGLSSAKKRARIGEAMDAESVNELNDLIANGRLEKLLSLMQEASSPSKAKALGELGKGAVTDDLQKLGADLDTIQHKLIRGSFERDEATIPFAVEIGFGVASGEDGYRQVLTGLNYTPTYEIPFQAGQAIFQYEVSKVDLQANTLWDLFRQLHIEDSDPVVVLAHLVCPSLEHTERGKSRPVLNGIIGEAVAKALWLCAKDWFDYKRKLEREARQQEREAEELRKRQDEKPSQKDVASELLQDAVDHARGDLGIASVRDVWYSLRDMIIWRHEEDLVPDYEYFSQNLFGSWIDRGGDAENIYNEARGVAVFPDGREMDLDTREVEGFTPEDWAYDKVLYIEKRGKLPQLKEAEIHRRHDLILVADPGYSTHATRAFLAKLAEQGCQILCAHDCDVDGWNILRTLPGPSRLGQRLGLPGFEVRDLGLRIQDVLEHNLPVQTRTYKKDLPQKLHEFMDEEDVEWLIVQSVSWTERGKRRSGWEVRYVELNALQGDLLVQWLESRLSDLGLARKLHPPRHVRRDEALRETREAINEVIQSEVKHAIEDLLDLSELEEVALEIPLWYARKRTRNGRRLAGQVARDARADLESHPFETWQELSKRHAQTQAPSALDGFDVKAHVRRRLIEHLENTLDVDLQTEIREAKRDGENDG